MRYLSILLTLLILFSCNQPQDPHAQNLNGLSEDFPQPSYVTSQTQNGFQPGDILFQSNSYRQSTAIKIVTESEYSHCGIVLPHKGKLVVFEAVEPVKITPIEEWIDRGDGRAYAHKRLRESEKVLREEAVSNMMEYALDQIGKHYDLYFGWGEDRMYCSELVWKAYKEGTGLEVGRVEQMKDFDLSSRVFLLQEQLFLKIKKNRLPCIGNQKSFRKYHA